MASGPRSKAGGAKPAPETDFARFFADMKLPGRLDMEAFLEVNRKNLETLATANRVAIEGTQAVARRNIEMMQSSLTELAEAMKALADTDAPRAKAARQAELLKQAYQHAVANMKELSDLIQQSSAEALSVINKRFAEAMDEVKALAEKAK